LADEFSAAVRKGTLHDGRLMVRRMSLLIAADLEKLSFEEITRLQERCADLPAYPGMTALRRHLGMVGPKAVDNLLVELARQDNGKAGQERLIARYRLAEDQIRVQDSDEIASRITAFLATFTSQDTIRRAPSLEPAASIPTQLPSR